jgi:hypothetical protein
MLLVEGFGKGEGLKTEVYELILTLFCSSKEVIQLHRKNVMAFKMSKV